MTVNERLFNAGLLGGWDRVRASGEVEELNRLLAEVGLKCENGSYWNVKTPAEANQAACSCPTPEEEH